LGHGERVLKAANALLGQDAYGLDISGKVYFSIYEKNNNNIILSLLGQDAYGLDISGKVYLSIYISVCVYIIYIYVYFVCV